ncbi:aromatic acid exporter family protein [Cohnella silvisoli]|uniref:Aromatic acid exporter family protein n=1 Tax=Cohnella silvisoli TaxID=2873699 RepID=A0ABV1KP12_9BACL|nr:aromatic acid exporter family protein [Cohnella silvisoli]MCD9021026.1 aromatic acid exporter family protein [Cohnella silvisoli]
MGFRVIKTAIAALTAIYTAFLIGVDNPLSAGLLAILGVETTRWRGINAVFARFMASIFGLLLASSLFEFIGFYIWVLAVYILLAYPLLARTGLKDGIITGSVIVFHLFARGEVTLHAIVTELELLVIGLGWATVFNLIYMPKESNALIALRNKTEEGFSEIFRHLAMHLRNPDLVWDGEEVLRTESAIEEGIEVSQRARENRLIPQDEPWQLYFQMRRQQLESIQLMMESVAFVSRHVPQAELIAVLFDRLTEDVKSEYYEGETERMLTELEKSFRSMPLPATRDEFETRSALFHLSRELRRYLAIASREKKRKSISAPAIIQ